MANARINIKNIDYFKFKKIIVDGNRDDYSACSKEVKTFCDSVQTLNFRDELFDDAADRDRFGEICGLYKEILKSKRIDSLDMRIKSGWWGDHKNAYSAGKIKPAVLKEILASKTINWRQRHSDSATKESEVVEQLEGPGLYVFKHKEHQCFQFVGRADKIVAQCGEKLRAAYEGTVNEPLAALLIISMATDWDFYYIPVATTDDERLLCILENDLILKHDCIWPHGLNFRLKIDSLLEVSEFRKSCIRHQWPPAGDDVDALDLVKLRVQVSNFSSSSEGVTAKSGAPEVEKPSEKPSVQISSSASAPLRKTTERKPERPKSGSKPTPSKGTKPLSPSSSSSQENISVAPPSSKSPRPTTPKKEPPSPKNTSAPKKLTPKPAADKGKAEKPTKKNIKQPQPIEREAETAIPLSPKTPDENIPPETISTPVRAIPRAKGTKLPAEPQIETETDMSQKISMEEDKLMVTYEEKTQSETGEESPKKVHPKSGLEQAAKVKVEPQIGVEMATPQESKDSDDPTATEPPPEPRVVGTQQVEEEVQMRSPEASPEREEATPVKTTLRRSGTYEVLPGIENDDQNDANDDALVDETGEKSQDQKPALPKSRLPVCKN